MLDNSLHKELSMLKIYGSPRSSAGRCYLLLEEVGVPYQPVAIDMMEKKEHKAPEFLKLNPNGKVPCLVDGEFVIWESMAINRYLADKYKPQLLGSSPEDRGLIEQWSLWALLELQPPMVDLIIQTMFMPENKRDAGVIARAQEKVPTVLAVLDQALKGRDYLVGSELSLADLNTASVVNVTFTVKINLDPYKNLLPWFNKIKNRPSFQKLAELRS